jgi:putative membrane protein
MFFRGSNLWGPATALPVVLLAAAVACPRSSAQASSMDQQFATNAASAGVAEVKLGQLAEQKAATQQVKDFGKRMVTDHSEANDKLEATAKKQGVNIPTSMTPEDQATYDKLSKLYPTEFDKVYMADQVTDHKHVIAEFEREAKDGKDPAMRQFAENTLPTLREHLQLAERDERTINSANTSSSKM